MTPKNPHGPQSVPPELREAIKAKTVPQLPTNITRPLAHAVLRELHTEFLTKGPELEYNPARLLEHMQARGANGLDGHVLEIACLNFIFSMMSNPVQMLRNGSIVGMWNEMMDAAYLLIKMDLQNPPEDEEERDLSNV